MKTSNKSNISPEIEFKANYQEGRNAIGGKIVITPELLIFKAHGFNFGDKSNRIFQIKDIIGYEKGFLTKLTIKFSNELNIILAVWNKQEIINALEIRRKVLTQ